tara:strand:+ start:568 stop:801 length:234 start_codon:yes stop_codon:yes gene_type:complete
LNFIQKPLKFFLFNAYKPWQDRMENLEALMHMNKIMSTESEYWSISNQTIPMWFYQMVISMGIALTFGFALILFGSL